MSKLGKAFKKAVGKDVTKVVKTVVQANVAGIEGAIAGFSTGGVGGAIAGATAAGTNTIVRASKTSKGAGNSWLGDTRSLKESLGFGAAAGFAVGVIQSGGGGAVSSKLATGSKTVGAGIKTFAGNLVSSLKTAGIVGLGAQLLSGAKTPGIASQAAQDQNPNIVIVQPGEGGGTSVDLTDPNAGGGGDSTTFNSGTGDGGLLSSPLIPLVLFGAFALFFIRHKRRAA